MSHWGIVGDGKWGMALARRLKANGHSVTVAGLEARTKKGVPRGVKHTVDSAQVLQNSERIILAVSIRDFASTIKAIAPHLRPVHRLMSTARGLTPTTHLRGTEVIGQFCSARQMAVLAGAADAGSLANDSPVALVVGSAFPSWAADIQEALWSHSLRVYTNEDMVGVELANVVAAVVGVALSVARSLKVGPAAEATALTRALAEMNRVVSGLGGTEGTAFGLAGLGVLGEMVYAGQGASFNAGSRLAKGESTDEPEFFDVREATRTLIGRIRRHHIHAPLVEAVHHMFIGQLTADEALTQLMERPVGAEA